MSEHFHRAWAGLSLRGQITVLLVATVLVFEIITTIVEYRALHERAVDRGRTTASEFAHTVFSLLTAVPVEDRSELAALLVSPHRAVSFGAPPETPPGLLPTYADETRAALNADRIAVDQVVFFELPDRGRHSDGASTGRGTEINVAMRPAGEELWIIASVLSVPKPATVPLLITASLESLAALVTLLVVLAIMRRLMVPLGRLSETADRIAHGEPAETLPLQGSADMRETTKTFNQMSESISQTIAYQQSLLHSLGHDLKAPLASARGLVSDAVAPPVRDRIESSLERVQQILASITDFTRATLRDGSVEPVDLGALVEALVEEAEDRGHVITTELSYGLAVPARYYALGRALRNLIENAAIYGRDAHVVLGKDADFAVLRIEDQGDGIPEEMLEQMFKPFSRLSDDPRGSGLGLAIARTIVVDHGGSLSLENRPEGGLLQTVRLPL